MIPIGSQQKIQVVASPNNTSTHMTEEGSNDTQVKYQGSLLIHINAFYEGNTPLITGRIKIS